MILCHAITNNFLYSAIQHQLYQSGQGTFYTLPFNFLCEKKVFELDNYFRNKKSTPLEKELMKLREKTFSRLLENASDKR